MISRRLFAIVATLVALVLGLAACDLPAEVRWILAGRCYSDGDCEKPLPRCCHDTCHECCAHYDCDEDKGEVCNEDHECEGIKEPPTEPQPESEEPPSAPESAVDQLQPVWLFGMGPPEVARDGQQDVYMMTDGFSLEQDGLFGIGEDEWNRTIKDGLLASGQVDADRQFEIEVLPTLVENGFWFLCAEFCANTGVLKQIHGSELVPARRSESRLVYNPETDMFETDVRQLAWNLILSDECPECTQDTHCREQLECENSICVCGEDCCSDLDCPEGVCHDGECLRREPETPEAFLQKLKYAFEYGDSQLLVGYLDPRVITEYEGMCERYMEQVSAHYPHLEYVSHKSLESWTYDSTVIHDVVEVEVNYTVGGQTTREVIHFALYEGSWGWFARCDPDATLGPTTGATVNGAIAADLGSGAVLFERVLAVTGTLAELPAWYALDPTEALHNILGLEVVPSGLLQEDGTFTIADLPPGRYIVLAGYRVCEGGLVRQLLVAEINVTNGVNVQLSWY